MKKLFSVFTSAILALSLGACSTNQPNKETPQVTLQGFEQNLQKPGTLVIGTSPDYPPYESLSATGQLIGFDIDLMNAVASTITTSDGKTYQIEWVQMSFDTIISAIQAGQVDLGVSGFTYDKERDVLFSTPYIESQQVVLTNTGSAIVSLADLEGKSIGVQLGTTGEIAAKDIPSAQVMSIDNVGVLIESLKNNAVDAVVVDKAVGENYVKNAGLVMLAEPLVDENMSVIAKKGNEALMAKLNAAIESVKQSSDYAKLLKTWELGE